MDWSRPEFRLREQDLAGKVAVITGASKGIGRSILINLATRGCSVVGTCSSQESIELLEQLASEISQLIGDPINSKPTLDAVLADITSPNCAMIIANTLRAGHGGRVDILVNNAAVTGGHRMGQNDPDAIQRKLFANIQTPIMIVDELVNQKMFQPNSRIINISSDRARNPSSQSLVYSASKAALESLARTWALQLGGNDPEYAFMAGTTANSVSVGATETEAIKRIAPEQRGERVKEATAGQVVSPESKPHLGQPEDVADVVGMLCSREARWITGSVIPANGGSAFIH